MGIYEDKLRELADLRKEETEKRQARDEKEIEEVVRLLASDDSYLMVRFEESTSDLPGHVVVRRPGSVEMARYKQVIFTDSSQRGAVERKANAGSALAAQCLVWPSRERYNALCEKYTLVPEAIAKRLTDAADAGAAEEGKG
jgi:hypothetical protein